MTQQLDKLPEGYQIIAIPEPGTVVVGMDFRHMSQDCAPEILYEGQKYLWGPLTYVPKECANQFCCCREYYLA
jgi:hypothetical protein